MRHLSYLLFGLSLFGLLQVPLLGQTKKDSPKEVPKTPACLEAICPGPAQAGKIVFVVNGAGDDYSTSDNLQDAREILNAPFKIVPIKWCRHDHPGRDYLDHQAQLQAAYKLASMTQQLRKEQPQTEIYYHGHSSGTRIVLAAAEMVPDKSVERIILSAATVSSVFDLRPALRGTKSGIDNFWSREDDLLEVVVEKYGLPDGTKGQPAGRAGFRPPPWCDAKGLEAYKNVRQYRWNDDYRGQGGHWAWNRTHSMKCYIVPLIMEAHLTACSVIPAPAGPALPPVVPPAVNPPVVPPPPKTAQSNTLLTLPALPPPPIPRMQEAKD